MNATLKYGRLGFLITVLSVLLCQAQAIPVTVRWKPVTAPWLAGYRISYGLTNGGTNALTVGLTNRATLPPFNYGLTYFIFAQSFVTGGIYSLPSSVIVYTARPPAPQWINSRAYLKAGPFIAQSSGDLENWKDAQTNFAWFELPIIDNTNQYFRLRSPGMPIEIQLTP